MVIIGFKLKRICGGTDQSCTYEFKFDLGDRDLNHHLSLPLVTNTLDNPNPSIVCFSRHPCFPNLQLPPHPLLKSETTKPSITAAPATDVNENRKMTLRQSETGGAKPCLSLLLILARGRANLSLTRLSFYDALSLFRCC